MDMKWMKHAALLLLVGMAAPALAQEDNGRQEQKEQAQRPPREIPSPENNARRISKEMKKALNLTEEQYTEMYELYLKEQKASMPDAATRGNMPPQGGMGRPPQGGGPGMGGPGGFGPEMGGGMPPQGGGFRPDGNAPSQEDMEKQIKKMEKKREKAYKKMEKKMKKLLDENQFTQWKSLDIDWRSKGMKPEGQPHPEGEKRDGQGR